MAILPTQPQRGVSPGGMPGPPMQGQGRGPNVGMPRAQAPIPSSVPGVNDVAEEPNPDDIAELFNAYTSGQLSREQLINQLDVFSEGRGGILGLLESMESPQEGVEGGGMPGAPPNPMGGESPSGAIPPLEGKLDKRHLLISAKLQDYGITAEDADQMATVLNPNEEGVPYAWEQEQLSLTMPGDTRLGAGSVTKQGAFDAAKTFNKWSDDEIWESINTQYPNAPMTSADINVDYTPRSVVEGRTSGPVGLDIDEDEGAYQPRIPTPPQQPRETGQLVYDEETGQMVDSGTWMPPKAKPAPTPAIPAVPDRGNVNDPMFDVRREGQETGQLVWDNEIGQMVDSGTRMPPMARGGIRSAEQLAEIQRQQELEKQQWQGGGSVGDAGQSAGQNLMDAYARQGGAYGDMAAAAPPQEKTIRDPSGNIIPLDVYEKFQESRAQQAQIGTGPLSDSVLDWLREQLAAGQEKISDPSMPEWLQGVDIKQLLQNMFTTPGTPPPGIGGGGAINQTPAPTPAPSAPGSIPGIVGDLSAQAKPPPEDPLFGAGVGKITGRERGEPGGPSVVKGPADVLGQAPGAYTGETTKEVWTPEMGMEQIPSETEPFETGFKTAADFDIPELKTFLTSLSDEARTGQAGEMLTQSLVDGLTAISQERIRGNVALAQSNTQAAMAFLDRAALTTRESANRALAESQQALTTQQQEIENQRIALAEGRATLEQEMAIGELSGQYNSAATMAQQELTRVNKVDEFQRVMARFAATGEVPQVDKDGKFIMEDGQPKVAGETFEQEKTYAQLAQQRQISMTETFGKLLNFNRKGELVGAGLDDDQTMETLEAQAFGFTKLIQQGEQAGRLMEADGKGGMQVMTDTNLITTDNPEVIVDTLEARRFAWEKDVNLAREKWMGQQLENDITTAELEAATQQYSDQLSNLVESGKLAEAIAARKEKGASDRKLQEHKKNELRVSTLLTLAKPETMLFVQRYNLLDDLGAALGIDFSVEQIPQPEPMVEPGTYPTTRMLQMATPGERQIMLAETAAWGGAAADSASAQSAMERIRDWTPGSKPLRRGVVSKAAR